MTGDGVPLPLAFAVELAAAGPDLSEDEVGALRDLMAAATAEEAQRATSALDNMLEVQGVVYPGAETAVGPLLQIVCRGAPPARHHALDLLIFMAVAESGSDTEDVAARCRALAREGLALLYALVDDDDRWTRVKAGQLAAIVDDDRARASRILGAVIRDDPDPVVRKFVAEELELEQAKRAKRSP